MPVARFDDRAKQRVGARRRVPASQCFVFVEGRIRAGIQVRPHAAFAVELFASSSVTRVPGHVERFDPAEAAAQRTCGAGRGGDCQSGEGRPDRLAELIPPDVSAHVTASARAPVPVGELQCGQPCVELVGAHEFGMRALRDDAAVVHDDDAVGLQHRREPMRDDDRRAPLHQAIERGLHQSLALGIERAGRFVEQQDRRIAQDGARDGDALALAAGKPRAALAEERVVALRQLAQELVGRGGRGRGFDFGVGGVGPAVADVLARRWPRTARCPAARGRCGCAAASGSARAMSTPSIEDPARLRDRRNAAAAGTSCSCRRPTVRRTRSSRPVARAGRNASSAFASGRDG